MYDRIIKYLAPFVIVKTMLQSIFVSIASVFTEINTASVNLKDETFTGKGIKKLLDEYKIFYLPSDDEASLQAKLADWENICSNRGTEQGIIYDLSCLPNVDYALLKGMNEAGEIVGDINPIDDPACCLDLHKIITIYPLESFRIDETTRNLIKNYIVPIEINPIFME